MRLLFLKIKYQKNKTKYAVSLFKKWLVENFQDDSFEELTDPNLNELLLVFYPEIRSETGQSPQWSVFAVE